MTRPMALRTCKCGKQDIVSKWKLDNGFNLKCRSCASRDANIRHGGKGTPTYGTWLSMKRRCINKSYREYKYWGGRGIKVCDRWMTYENFLADMGQRPTGTTLDRIDNNGNYQPGNCRWATPAEQTANRRPLVGTRLINEREE